MSIKKYIDDTARKTAMKVFRNIGISRKSEIDSGQGLVKVISITDGQYEVELKDGSTKMITPSGSRAVAPGSIIFISGDTQLY